jgi:indolepyruvate ferredoxin oxidoreductase
VHARERAVAPDSAALTRAVARGLYKLMAYKDEYEVARLLLDADGRAAVDGVGPGTVRYHLHPPVLRSLGLTRKVELGPWSDPVLRALARAKAARGRWYDPFGWPEVRRTERALVREYRAGIERVLPRLDAANLPEVVALADLPDLVRGYEHLKLERAAEFRVKFSAALDRVEGAPVLVHPSDPPRSGVPDGSGDS